MEIRAVCRRRRVAGGELRDLGARVQAIVGMEPVTGSQCEAKAGNERKPHPGPRRPIRPAVTSVENTLCAEPCLHEDPGPNILAETIPTRCPESTPVSWNS